MLVLRDRQVPFDIWVLLAGGTGTGCYFSDTSRDQYHDRMLGVLTIIIDSMDKAKIAWPQWAFRKPKAYDHCHRPRLVLSGTMDGWCTDLSFMFCEILEQTIACVAAMIGARDGPDMTSHLCVQSDNTTSQGTNYQACEFLSGDDRLQRLMHDVCNGGHIPPTALPSIM